MSSCPVSEICKDIFSICDNTGDIRPQAIKSEFFDDDSLDDVADLISRAEAIIEENRQRIQNRRSQNLDSIREQGTVPIVRILTA